MPLHPLSHAEDRSLSEQESGLIRWLLEHGENGAAAFVPQLADTRVVGKCECGCASIDLAVGGQPRRIESSMEILADFVWRDDAGRLFGAFVFAFGGILAGLDLWSVDGESVPVGLPQTHELISMAEWDQRSRPPE
jgi:hypothetical protein